MREGGTGGHEGPDGAHGGAVDDRLRTAWDQRGLAHRGHELPIVEVAHLLELVLRAIEEALVPQDAVPELCSSAAFSLGSLLVCGRWWRGVSVASVSCEVISPDSTSQALR